MNQIAKQFDDLRYKTGCYYTKERNKQIVLYLLKRYGIRKAVVSPGATNFALVGSMQHDPFFEMYSCVDERAAAYMAIGIAEKSGEPVALSCTGATASRNYMAALTYAYKKNLPILVITSSLSLSSVGHLKAQVTDREHSPIDMIYRSYQFDNIKDSEDEWRVNVKCNEALNLLYNTKKPILINVCTNYSINFAVRELPPAKYIPTYTKHTNLPLLPATNICIFVGSHKRFSDDLVQAVERFCDSHNAIVLCDHTSGYSGRYRVNMTLPFCQNFYSSRNRNVGLLIHLGEISGDYYSFDGICPRRVWRVNPDGLYSDFFQRLDAVFKMDEIDFFSIFTDKKISKHQYFDSCIQDVRNIRSKLAEVPFSNIWVADQLHDKLPVNSQIHFGILNSLRSWDFYNLPEGVESCSNVGGFGIDGCVSSMIGATLMSPNKLFYGVVGDLTFYYDSNILLNQKLPKNFRLIVMNNGRGIEFRNYCHPATQALGVSVDSFVAAAGHFGNQQHSSIKELCYNLNVDYLQIKSKLEFLKAIDRLVSTKSDKALIVECLTSPDDESAALRSYRQCIPSPLITKKKIIYSLIKIMNKFGLKK